VTSLLSLTSAPRVLEPGSTEWPRQLDALSPPLASLRVAGRLPPGPTVAIVGTRSADPEAEDFARAMAAFLAERGCVVVSGGARGIDAAAHRGALEAGGSTVAVLGTGLRYAYPREHGPLLSEIARCGALVTEASDEVSPRPGLFLRRNRIVAALARTVVVVQAPLRSGALSTAAHAAALERPVWAVPAAPWDARGLGGLTLLAQGKALLCTDGDAVLAATLAAPATPASGPLEVPGGRRGGKAAGRSHRVAALQGRNEAPRRIDDGPNACTTAENETATRPVQTTHPALAGDADAGALWEALARPRHVDELARRLGWSIARVQRTVTTLSVSGLVEDRGTGRYARRRPRPGRAQR
jgi:DNA processing protein